MLLIRSDGETLDAVLHFGQTLHIAAVSIHAVYLHRVGFLVFGQESDFLAVGIPADVTFGTGSLGETLHVLAVGIHHIDLGVTLVFLDIFVGEGEDDFRPVGRRLRVADAAERFQHFRSHHAVHNLYVRLLDDFFTRSLVSASGQSKRQQHGTHGQSCFVHVIYV